MPEHIQLGEISSEVFRKKNVRITFAAEFNPLKNVFEKCFILEILARFDVLANFFKGVFLLIFHDFNT